MQAWAATIPNNNPQKSGPLPGNTSRTAVNIASRGRSQLAGVFAALVILLVLFVMTAPLASVPDAALSAVIIMAAIGLFDGAAPPVRQQPPGIA